jgi:hypothetical protein
MGCCISRPKDKGKRVSEDYYNSTEGDMLGLKKSLATDEVQIIDTNDYLQMLKEKYV